uniref:Protease Do-like 9 n=1 Tax=Rhizophora mucronata TaxID=61149 RepID=A0A2P2IKW4_RHIMU
MIEANAWALLSSPFRI